MATLTQIRDALAAVVLGVDDEISTYPRIPQKPNLPAAVVVPTEGNLAMTMKRGVIELQFEIFLLVSVADFDNGQRDLDVYLDLDSPQSVPSAIWNTGAPPGTILPGVQARVTGWRDYGGKFEAAGVDHLGVRLLVPVLVSRSS